MRMRLLSILAFAMLGACGMVQRSIPADVSAPQVTGSIRICGSPQMGRLLRIWETGFQKFQPGVHFQNDLKSTSSAMAGLDSNQADIALLGRDLWPAEIHAFQSIYGHGPTSVQVATGSFDVPKATFALMVFVHEDNPLTKVSIEQLRRIFGETTSPHEIRTWGELRLTGAWATQAIHLYGFNLENDKGIFFRARVFGRTQRWNDRIQQYSNSRTTPPIDAGQLILNSLAKDRYGMAISNLHYAVPGVKVLAIVRHNGGPFIVPTRESVQARTYPLARPVHMVVRVDARQGIDPKVCEFLRYILSSRGQEDVRKQQDYLPLTDRVVRAQLSSLAEK